ncbi:hypothetical protein RCL_jg16467.t1 [Rhizophagus clarus]|uniref:Uncharacterized protein n=1 Tax=Rhizophagus clarus TaxID=94130 RepID=A0A8H3LMK5_9GLOM|nr:hypothetical protein RCL_jg16467.t1 [Rhizophagus clarus]
MKFYIVYRGKFCNFQIPCDKTRGIIFSVGRSGYMEFPCGITRSDPPDKSKENIENLPPAPPGPDATNQMIFPVAASNAHVISDFQIVIASKTQAFDLEHALTNKGNL